MQIYKLAGILEERGRLSVTGPSTQLYVLTDEETANNIKATIGVGTIKAAGKQYRYNLARVIDVYHVLKTTMPYFETDALSHEFEVVKERLSNLTPGFKRPSTRLAPEPPPPAPIDDETLKKIRKIFRNKPLDRVFKHGRVYMRTNKKNADLLQATFGGRIKIHKDKGDDTNPFRTWRLDRKGDVARLKDVLGVE